MNIKLYRDVRRSITIYAPKLNGSWVGWIIINHFVIRSWDTYYDTDVYIVPKIEDRVRCNKKETCSRYTEGYPERVETAIIYYAVIDRYMIASHKRDK